jgi:hypothetical protein
MTTTSGAQQRTQEVASSAAGEGKHVAGVAKDEAAGVASEAMTQARSVAHGVLRDVSGQVNEQSRSQQDRLGSTLRGLGDDLEKMAAQADTGLAGDLAREVADRARSVSQHLEDREPGELLDDVRRFARQRPGTFLLGALGAGVVAGRLLRGTKDGAEAAAATPRPASPDLTTGATPGTTPGATPGLAAGTTPGTPNGTYGGESGTVAPPASPGVQDTGLGTPPRFDDGGDLLGGGR